MRESFKTLVQPPGEPTAPAQVLLPDEGQSLPKRILNHRELCRLGDRYRALIHEDDASQNSVQRSTFTRGLGEGPQLPQDGIVRVRSRDSNCQGARLGHNVISYPAPGNLSHLSLRPSREHRPGPTTVGCLDGVDGRPERPLERSSSGDVPAHGSCIADAHGDIDRRRRGDLKSHSFDCGESAPIAQGQRVEPPGELDGLTGGGGRSDPERSSAPRLPLKGLRLRGRRAGSAVRR